MNNGCPGASRCCLFLLVLFVCLASIGCGPRPRYEDETIQRLQRSPGMHAGRAVILHGTTADPVDGSSAGRGALGSYLLLDGNGRSLRVLTRRPPGAGISCRVTGFAGQSPENALSPLVLETSRRRPGRDLLLVLGLLILVAGSLPLAVALARRQVAAPPAPRPGSRCILELQVVAGPDRGRRHIFQADRILVGRSGMRHNDLTLDDQTVSRTQAMIVRDEKLGGYKILNEGRTNPLKLNGRPCDAVALRHGDLLTVGRTVLRVGYREPPGGGGDTGSRPLCLLLWPLLLALSCLPALGGTAGEGDEPVLEQLDLRQLPMVTCHFRIPGAGGQGGLGLGLEDFRLQVDGRPPETAEIQSRLAPGQPPLRLVLVLQVSPEERGRGLFLLKSAVDDLLQRLPAETLTALVTHGSGARVEQRPTTDRHELLTRLAAIRLDGADEVGGSYYRALELAAGLFPEAEPAAGAVVYFCRPGIFTRGDMRPETPKALRVRPAIPIYPVLLPERDGSRTGAYLRQLTPKLTAGFDGYYTLSYQSPGGEDNRVHSLRIDRISSAGGSGGSSCRYLAAAGTGLESGALLEAADRRTVQDRLAGLLPGLLAGLLAFRWLVGIGGRAGIWLRLHFMAAGALVGLLVSLLAGNLF